jgi:phospho-N-acetylmuramoyl-pentapeptide-transferase
MIALTLTKVLLPAATAFLIGIAVTPALSGFMYKYKLWKRVSRLNDNPTIASGFKKIHDGETEVRTPRVGGMVVWVSIILTTLIFWGIARYTGANDNIFDFVSRRETWLPLAGIIVGAALGMIEDLLEIWGGTGKVHKSLVHGMPSRYLIPIIALIGLIGGLWFYIKLDMHTINIPFWTTIDVGWWFVPFFILVMLGTFSSRVIDGVDGLSGGVLATIFTSYGFIAFSRGQYDIMTLSLVIAGALLAFLWFNVPPARFYMGETGMLPLTLALTTIAFLTNEPLLLLVIGFPLVATAFSSFIQIISKRVFHKKVFLVAPLHHHFEALGWSRPKITMRYWIVSLVCGIIGIVIALWS